MEIGKAPANALKRSVFRQIKTKREEVASGAGIGRDCASLWFPPGEGLVTCMQEAVIDASAVPWQGRSRGRLPETGVGMVCDSTGMEPTLTLADLIQKCANNLAAGGGVPVAVMIALLLPEGLEEPCIKELMTQASEKCQELSVQMVGGQTRISGAAAMPMAVVTGYGRALESGRGRAKAAEPGQDVVVSKWIGLQGTAYIARKNRARLFDRYPAYLVEKAMGFDRYLSVLPEAGVAAEAGVSVMHDASEGGIFGALWELAEGSGVGLTVDMRKLPLRQETVEVCECCGVNPYELLSGGCLIMTTFDGAGLASALEAAHIPARIVGKVTDSHDRILVNGDEIRYMDRPKQDSVYKGGGFQPDPDKKQKSK